MKLNLSICEGRLRSLTPNCVGHVLLELSLCTVVLSYLNRFGSLLVMGNLNVTGIDCHSPKLVLYSHIFGLKISISFLSEDYLVHLKNTDNISWHIYFFCNLVLKWPKSASQKHYIVVFSCGLGAVLGAETKLISFLLKSNCTFVCKTESIKIHLVS